METTTTEFVLQHKCDGKWSDNIRNERLQFVLGYAKTIKVLAPNQQQRILRRITTTIDEELISEIE